jgi:hypothetical protein
LRDKDEMVRRIIKATARFVRRVRDRRWVSRDGDEVGFEGKYVRGRREEVGSGSIPFSLMIGIAGEGVASGVEWVS